MWGEQAGSGWLHGVEQVGLQPSGALRTALVWNWLCWLNSALSDLTGSVGNASFIYLLPASCCPQTAPPTFTQFPVLPSALKNRETTALASVTLALASWPMLNYIAWASPLPRQLDLPAKVAIEYGSFMNFTGPRQ